MNFLLAPNAMKGALTARQSAQIILNTLQRKYPGATVIPLPIADGGNGTLDCLISALGGTVHTKEVTGPIPSMKVTARYGITKNNIAIIESAEAIGLHLLTPSSETITQSTTIGIGELIQEAKHHHCTEIWIGLGGSATNDGGAGMAQALGIGLLDEQNENIRDGSIFLHYLRKITNYEILINTYPIKILSDVTNPLLGEHGATFTFARQKGATQEQLPYLESALKHFADVVETPLQKNCRNIPGAGAAGGLGFGLMAFCNAELQSGIDFILDAVHFNDNLPQCDCIITTEGKIDEQTLFGKGIAGICHRAKKIHKPVHAFVGKIEGDRAHLQEQLGLASLTQISPDTMPADRAMHDASWLLADAVFQHNF